MDVMIMKSKSMEEHKKIPHTGQSGSYNSKRLQI